MGEKAYHVYAIGNAVVDLEFQVEDALLAKMGVAKGVMTLVDEEAQEELLTGLAGLPVHRGCGGSAANTAVAMANLGAATFYSCRVADDEWGEFFQRNLNENAVANNLTQRPPGRTARCVIMVTPDAQRSMNTHLGVSREFGVEQMVWDELARSRYLYVEGHLVGAPLGLEAACQACKFARKHGVRIALSLSDPSVPRHFHAGLSAVLADGPIDLLFCNQEEAFLFTGENTLEGAADKLARVAHSTIITQGKVGASVFCAGEEGISVSAPVVQAVDTNGAGDLFAAAFLYATGKGLEKTRAADFACRTASTLVAQMGPRLPRKQLLCLATSEGIR